MRPSPPPPALGEFPSSPSSVWSCTRSISQYPPTPDDSMEIMVPQHPKTDPCFLSDDDVRVFLRNKGRWENMYDHFESSPPLRPRNPHRVPPVSQDCTGDGFSWEATHSAILDPTELADPSRCSLLIHEVSLLIGLAPDDDYRPPDDSCHLIPDRLRHVPDILPLTLTPTKSLAARRYTPTPAHTNVLAHPSDTPISPSINPPSDDRTPTPHNVRLASDRSTPLARRKYADSVRPSLSPHRRQGQVFHFEPPLSDVPRRGLDETFFHPREPPPKPNANSPADRCSSLDRLERSLQKLEAYAPRNHRKSKSEERSPHHAAQRNEKRPSLPPPRRLRKGQSSHEITYRNALRPAHACHSSDPPPLVPRPTPACQHVTPLTCRTVSSIEDLTPGSFMDMDIPCTEDSQKPQASFRQLTGKEKMKSLVKVAKTASRGFIAWGKNLTGSTKPLVTGQGTTAVQHSRF